MLWILLRDLKSLIFDPDLFVKLEKAGICFNFKMLSFALNLFVTLWKLGIGFKKLSFALNLFGKCLDGQVFHVDLSQKKNLKLEKFGIWSDSPKMSSFDLNLSKKIFRRARFALNLFVKMFGWAIFGLKLLVVMFGRESVWVE